MRTGVRGFPVPEERFTDRNDGTVKDELTGLIWARDANTFGTKTWQEALDACNGLEADSRGLKDGSKRGDWRLPNFNEMRSLVDYSQAAPALRWGIRSGMSGHLSIGRRLRFHPRRSWPGLSLSAWGQACGITKMCG